MSVLVGVRKKKEPVASEGMFQAHGGLFIFNAVKCIQSRGEEFTRRHCGEERDSQTDIARVSRAIRQKKKSLGEGSGLQAATGNSELPTLIFLLNRGFTAVLSRFCLLKKRLSH